MKITISKDLFTLFPDGKIAGLFIYGLNNKTDSDELQTLLKEYAGSMLKESPRLHHLKITSWDHVFTRLNIDSKELSPSHKSLLRRAISSGKVPDINPLVNIYNLISLKYSLPIGAHDMDKVTEIFVGKTSGEEKFIPMNETEGIQVDPEEYAYIDPTNKMILTRNLVWNQSEVDKITPESHNVFIPIDDIPDNFSYSELEKIAGEILNLVKIHLGYERAVFGIANKYTSVLDSDKLGSIEPETGLMSEYTLPTIETIKDEEKIDEILTKGVKEIFPSKEELKQVMMSGKRLKLYTGIDPTADFIHMGHMIWMKKLSEFQKLGHEVIFLIGGFTAMIGDPDKKYSREPLSKEQVNKNFANYKNDAAKLLDFDWEENPVTIKNNYDWLSKITLDGWLNIMSNVTLQHILSHDMFKKRLEEQTPVRLHEIIYPLLQGYDSVAMEVDLEVGGSDQTFNMLTGRILERNILGKEKYVLTMKLLTDNNGNKMGKTTGNAISFKDGPEDVYGKIMSFDDTVLPLAYELLSAKSLKQISEIIADLGNSPMKYKKDLAFEVTSLMHSPQAAEEASIQFEKVVQNKETPEDIKTFNISNLSNSEKINLVDLLEETEMVESRAEAKRLIQQGGVKIDGIKITELTDIEPKSDNTIQVGKRNWIKLV